jgi:hypothetical protein
MFAPHSLIGRGNATPIALCGRSIWDAIDRCQGGTAGRPEPAGTLVVAYSSAQGLENQNHLADHPFALSLLRVDLRFVQGRLQIRHVSFGNRLLDFVISSPTIEG